MTVLTSLSPILVWKATTFILLRMIIRSKNKYCTLEKRNSSSSEGKLSNKSQALAKTLKPSNKPWGTSSTSKTGRRKRYIPTLKKEEQRLVRRLLTTYEEKSPSGTSGIAISNSFKGRIRKMKRLCQIKNTKRANLEDIQIRLRDAWKSWKEPFDKMSKIRSTTTTSIIGRKGKSPTVQKGSCCPFGG